MGSPVIAIGRPNTNNPQKDDNVQQTLLAIETELRKANFYNEIKTDTHIKESDLEKE